MCESSGTRAIRVYGRALKTGIAAAAYDTIVISDADLTYPVEKLRDLLKEYSKEFDMVVGAHPGDLYRRPAIRAPLHRLLKWLVEFTLNKRIPDVNSGFRLFDRRPAMGHLDAKMLGEEQQVRRETEQRNRLDAKVLDSSRSRDLAKVPP
jgi:hypothetical protein